jgi:uroporphyrinogen decarboxylase
MIISDNYDFSVNNVLNHTKKREPDFKNLLKVLLREIPDRPTLFEFFMNWRIYNELTGIDFTEISKDHKRYNDGIILAFRNAGYDYATIPATFTFPLKAHAASKSFSQNETVMIWDRKSFDEYPWPDISEIDFTYMDDVGESLSPGMKAVPFGPGGVLENTTMILGYENMCYLIYDDPELVEDVFERVGKILYDYYDKVTDHKCAGALIVNDDWGYRTQTLLGIDDMRKYVIPWHKSITDRIHSAGKPAILHSCGQLKDVMEDIISYIGYDAKHSYEDAIMPVEEFYEINKERIAVCGGIDLDFVCTRSPKEVFDRSVAMLKKAEISGGYALGTGNSVPEYVPSTNYYAMLLAALI